MDRTCPRCLKVFKYPARLRRHNAGKTDCTQADPTKRTPPAPEEDITKPYPCPYCNKRFAHASGRSQHKKRCPSKPLDAEVNTPELRELTSRLAMLERALASCGMASPQGASLPAAAPAPAPTYGNPPQINNFGEETVSASMREEFGEVLDRLPVESAGPVIISAISRAIWADPSHPENQTVMIQDGNLYIKTENGWEARTELELYPQMIDRACMELNCYRSYSHPRLEERVAKTEIAFQYEPAAKSPGNAPKILRPLISSNAQHLRSLGVSFA